MSTKERILKLLEERRGEFVSGEAIADTVCVTRAGVWKAIKNLREEGFKIDAVTNRGYRLNNSFEEIDREMFETFLKDNDISAKFIYLDTVDSTNNEALRRSCETDGNIIVIAEEQTSGKGRRGRAFHSAKYSGLYISILIHTGRLSEIAPVTAIAAVAASTAIDKVVFSGRDTTKIKWVNDIYLDEKKVTGILSEAFSSMEDGGDCKVIVGTGINVIEPEEGFPKEIAQKAGALLKGAEHSGKLRTMLACEVTKRFLEIFENYETECENCLKFYREKSNLIGKYVMINPFSPVKEGEKYAKAVDIDRDYHLVVEYSNGRREALSSGEVSVVRY